MSCPTTVAIAATPTPVALPLTRPVTAPSTVAPGLAVYADTHGTMALVEPEDWNCATAYGADGSGGAVIDKAECTAAFNTFIAWPGIK